MVAASTRSTWKPVHLPVNQIAETAYLNNSLEVEEQLTGLGIRFQCLLASNNNLSSEKQLV